MHMHLHIHIYIYIYIFIQYLFACIPFKLNMILIGPGGLDRWVWFDSTLLRGCRSCGGRPLPVGPFRDSQFVSAGSTVCGRGILQTPMAYKVYCTLRLLHHELITGNTDLRWSEDAIERTSFSFASAHVRLDVDFRGSPISAAAGMADRNMTSAAEVGNVGVQRRVKLEVWKCFRLLGRWQPMWHHVQLWSGRHQQSPTGPCSCPNWLTLGFCQAQNPLPLETGRWGQFLAFGSAVSGRIPRFPTARMRAWSLRIECPKDGSGTARSFLGRLEEGNVVMLL